MNANPASKDEWLDAQMRAFFQHELRGFPPCPIAAELAVPAPASAATRDTSRLLLAASVAAMVTVGLSLPRIPNSPNPARPVTAATGKTLLDRATADGQELLDLARPMAP